MLLTWLAFILRLNRLFIISIAVAMMLVSVASDYLETLHIMALMLSHKTIQFKNYVKLVLLATKRTTQRNMNNYRNTHKTIFTLLIIQYFAFYVLRVLVTFMSMLFNCGSIITHTVFDILDIPCQRLEQQLSERCIYLRRCETQLLRQHFQDNNNNSP